MTPGDRLRKARERVGYSSAAAAAKAIGVPIATYTGHEANHRGFPAKKAAIYAKHFHVSLGWLLFGEEAVDPAAVRVPVVAVIDGGSTHIREVAGSGESVAAPSHPPGIRYAFVLAHDAQHQFAGWTLFGEEKTANLTQITEDKLCLVGLSDGHVVLAKPTRATTSGRYHLYFFGDQPRNDVKIKWVSRIVASRM